MEVELIIGTVGERSSISAQELASLRGRLAGRIIGGVLVFGNIARGVPSAAGRGPNSGRGIIWRGVILNA